MRYYRATGKIPFGKQFVTELDHGKCLICRCHTKGNTLLLLSRQYEWIAVCIATTSDTSACPPPFPSEAGSRMSSLNWTQGSHQLATGSVSRCTLLGVLANNAFPAGISVFSCQAM